MSEFRKEARQRTFLKGRIIFNNGASTMDCLIRDMSASGARLALSQSAILPDTFDLMIPIKEKTYRSTLCWRRSDGVGVTFFSEPAAAAVKAGEQGASAQNEAAAARSPAPAEASPEMMALTRRVRELEAENAALRQTLSTLLKADGTSAV